MSSKLTWDDLLIQNMAGPDVRAWLGYWSGMVSGMVAPVFMSKFGNWFLRRPDGSTEELSVIEGTYSTVASTPEQFALLVKTPAWQEEFLLSTQIALLHERGQYYAFATLPTKLGRIEMEGVVLMEIGQWQQRCARHFLPQS